MASKEKVGIASILARKNILELLPYRCARDDYTSGILLDANENAFGPPMDSVDSLERYPDPYQVPLKNKICSYRNGFDMGPENVFVGVVSECSFTWICLDRCFDKPSAFDSPFVPFNQLMFYTQIIGREVMKQ